MPRQSHEPSYRYHKARNCAVVTIRGKDRYLGAFNSPESREKYHRLVAEVLVNGHEPRIPAETPPATRMTVGELILRYWQYVESYYVKDGRPTAEPDNVRQAMRFVRRLYGSTPAEDFGPLAIKAVRQAMIEHPITRTIKVRNPITGKVVTDPTTGQAKTEVRVLRHGLTRKFINKQVGRIKRMFAWAVEEELLPASVHQTLLRVKPLKKGKTAAREKPRVKPVSLDHVEAVLPLVPPAIRAMIEVQRLTGCRPQDVVQLRGADIERCGPVWEYRPGRYKTEHHDADGSDAERVIFLGPKAQALITPFLASNPSDFLFSPRRSEEQRLDEHGASGKRQCGRRTFGTRPRNDNVEAGRRCAIATMWRRTAAPSGGHASGPTCLPGIRTNFATVG